MNKLLLIIMQIFCFTSFAGNKIPDQLFGITLGGIYKVDLSDLPVKKITGFYSFLGKGEHFYFEPIDGAASKMFPYVEEKKTPDDKFYKTSFHSYMLPVIPNNIDSAEKLENLEEKNWKVEIASIDWTEFPKEEKNNNKTEEDINENCYFWAINLCKTFEVHFSIKPNIINDYESKKYICTFSSDGKELVVTGMGFKEIQLHHKKEIFDKKNETIDTILRKIAAKQILPE